jgi:CheY-like chemotaxis protein
MSTILVADDNQDELKEIVELLEKEGKYTIQTASNPESALELMKPSLIRAAILDYKLTDGAAHDESGLRVAQNSSSLIPKIIVSRHADEDDVKKFFGADAEGRMVVFAFISKEGLKANLVRTVERALAARKVWDQKERESLQGQLLYDYKIARLWDYVNTGLGLGVNVFFLVLLFRTLNMIHSNELNLVLGSVAAVAIIVSEIVVTLFLEKRSEGSGRRAENYHMEVVQAWRLEQLLRATDSLNLKARNEAKLEIISVFANQWNPNTAAKVTLKSETSEISEE